MKPQVQSEGVKTQAAETTRLRIFLSYSRKDDAFIARLAEALTARGYLADYDRSTHDKDNVETGISAEDEWWQRLQDMIAAADVMVFAVSPDSAASKVCDEEIVYARTLGKRVIAVLRRGIDFGSAPPRLAALNVKIDLTADDEAGFLSGLESLCAALDRDVAWLREQTRLQLAALDWRNSGLRDEELLRGAEISEAEAWSARRPANAPELSELVLAFLVESRKAEGAREARERRTLKRQRAMQRWLAIVLVVALVVTLTGGWFVIQGQRSLARQQSAFLAAEAAAEFDAGNYDRALRLAAVAARGTWLSPAAREAEFELGRAAAFSDTLALLPADRQAAHCAALAPDGKTMVTLRSTGLELFTETSDRGWRRTHLADVASATNLTCGQFSANGRSFVTPGLNTGVLLWTADERGGWVSQSLDDGWPENVAQLMFPTDDMIVVTRGSRVLIWRHGNQGWSHRVISLSDKPVTPALAETADTDAAAHRLIIEADASEDGDVLVIRSVDLAGDHPLTQVWTHASAGEPTVRELPLAADGALFVKVSPRGKRILAFGPNLTLFEQQENGDWFPAATIADPTVLEAELVSSVEDGDTVIHATEDGSLEELVFARAANGRLISENKILFDRREGALSTFDLADRNRYWHAVAKGQVLSGPVDLLEPRFKLQESAEIVQSANGSTFAVITLDGSIRVVRPDGTTFAERTVSSDGDLIQHAALSKSASTMAVVRRSENLQHDSLDILRRQSDGSWKAEMAGALLGAQALIASVYDDQIILTSQGGPAAYARLADGRWSARSFAVTNATGALASKNAFRTMTHGVSGNLMLIAELEDGRWIAEMEFPGTINGVGAVAPDGESVVTAAAGAVKVWQVKPEGWSDIVLGKTTAQFYSGIVFGPDGNQFAVSSSAGVDVWRKTSDQWSVSNVTRTPLTRHDPHFTSDGKLLATPSERNGWAIWSQREDGQWVGLSSPVANMPPIGFSSDGASLLIAGGRDIIAVDVHWLTGGPKTSAAGRAKPRRSQASLIASACASKLSGDDSPMDGGGLGALRRITAADVAAAPVLSGREGEDVCVRRLEWYDQMLDMVGVE